MKRRHIQCIFAGFTRSWKIFGQLLDGPMQARLRQRFKKLVRPDVSSVGRPCQFAGRPILRPFRPALEQLEAIVVPSTLTALPTPAKSAIISTAASSGTLGAALDSALANPFEGGTASAASISGGKATSTAAPAPRTITGLTFYPPLNPAPDPKSPAGGGVHGVGKGHTGGAHRMDGSGGGDSGGGGGSGSGGSGSGGGDSGSGGGGSGGPSGWWLSGGFTLYETEGTESGDVQVASLYGEPFLDSYGDPEYITSITIEWGDGTVSGGGIGYGAPAPIYGDHTYTNYGTYTIAIIVGTSLQGDLEAYSFADVSPQYPYVTANHSSVTGSPLAGNTGTYGGYNEPVSLGASSGTLTANSDGTWDWTGTGSVGASYTVTITATDSDGLTASTSFSVTIQGPNPVAGSNGTSCNCGCPNQEGTVNETASQDDGNLSDEESEEPVRYSDGVVQIAATDIYGDGFGGVWAQTRSWTNGAQYATQNINGLGWVDTEMPALVEVNGTTTIGEFSNGMGSQYFDLTSGVYVPRYFDQSTLVYNSGSDEYVMTDEVGDQLTFYGFSSTWPADQRGQLASMTDAQGDVTSVQAHNSAGQMTDVRRSNGSLYEDYLYTYLGSGNPNAGLLSNVTLERSTNSGSTWTTISQVAYTYYTGSQTHGNLGDLWTATVETPSGTAISTYYYRYYTAAEISAGAHGYLNGLEYVFTPDSYALLVANLGSSVDSLTNTQVAPYAANYFEYDSYGRSINEVAQGSGCSSCAGGLGTFTYTYTISGNAAGYNVWNTKSVVGLPDGNEDIVYTNAYGEVMLSVYEDTTTNQQWDTFYEYDSQGRCILMADPSAVTGFSESYVDLLDKVSGSYTDLASSTGLITLYDYYSSTTATATTAGGAAGYQEDVKVEQGQSGTPITQETWTYYSRQGTSGGPTIYVVATDEVYRNTNGTGGETTSTSYTWFSGTNQMQSETVSAPVISSGENGPGSADVTTTYFDSNGRPIWVKDPDGYLQYTAYDSASGAVTETINDVNTSITSDFTALPSGWSTPTGGGLNLVSTYVVDGFGRTTEATDPNGNVTYTVYDDVDQEVRVYAGWNSGTGMPTGPTVVTRTDAAHGYTETITMSATPHLTSGAPDGTESIGSLDSLERDYVNDAQQVVAVDSYFNLSGLTYSTGTMGTSGTNYYQTVYAYDADGNLCKTVTPTGTITRTVYDGQGRVVSTWIGTNDTPTSGYWSPTNPAGMTQVTADQYDGGGVGDGNLTQETDYPGGGAAARVTDYFYDWRDRLVATKEGVQSSESSGVNRPITYNSLDNLGQVTSVSIYDGDGVSISSTAGVPNAPSSGPLRAYSTTAYDDQGRAYQTNVYNVSQSTGTVSSSPIQTVNDYYNHRGELIEEALTGGAVTKTAYDGAGRVTATYTTNGAGGTSWSAAGSVTSDIVYEQVEDQYDADSNVIETITRERWNGQTATGALVNGSTAPKASVSYEAMYYDAANRPVADVNVGTNGASSWTRPGSVPSRSDSTLVSSYSYNAAGQVQDTTDPRGIDTRDLYDALGRVTTAIANYTGGTETNSSDISTVYTYDGSDHVVTETDVLPSSAQEQTEYVYGVTTTGGSTINSNDILAQVEHPDPSTGAASASYEEVFTVDALGEVLTDTDQNAHATSYSYNVLGQEVATTDALSQTTTMAYDAMGELISEVDPATHTTSYSYDGLGRQTAVTDPLGHATTTAYDASGNVTAVVDALTHTTSYTYDGLNRVLTETDPDGYTTSYAYNISGDEGTVTDAANTTYNSHNVTTYVYDSFGRENEMIDPQGHTASYAYDRDSNLTESIDRDGRTIVYTYDNLNRETGETWYGSGGGTAVETLTFSYDAVGNMLTANDTDGTHAYSYTMTYDKENRTTLASEPFAASLSMGYDKVGNRTSVTDSFGLTESSTYNADNELTLRSLGQSGGTLVHVALDYNGDGTIQEVDDFGSGSPAAEAAQTNYTYFANQEVSTISEKDSNGGGTATNSVNSFSYGYDNANRLTSKTENGTATSYGYDSDGQITTVNGTTVYSWDHAGNSAASGVTMTSANEMATDGTYNYTYDNEGNEITKTNISTGEKWTYAYNNRNEMVSAVERAGHSGGSGGGGGSGGSGGTIELSAVYRYDALGDRVEEDVTPYTGGSPGTTTVSRFAYDLWKDAGGHLMGGDNADVWADLNGSSSLTSRYLSGDVVDQVFARLDKSGSSFTPYWYLTDNLGSVRNVVDGTGHVQDTVSYGVFGNITSETNSSARGRYGWTGREQDVATGLQYNRARYYDPTTGRWLSQDPLGFDAGDSNLYRYVNNQLTDETDPSGEQGVVGGQFAGVFDEGKVSVPLFDTLQSVPDIFAARKGSVDMSLLKLLGGAGINVDFSKEQAVTGKLGDVFDSYQRVIRTGMDAAFRAEFNKGVNEQRYFWSQIVQNVGNSTNTDFTTASKMGTTLPDWDGGYTYPYGNKTPGSSTLLDTPTINIPVDEIPTKKGDSLIFTPPIIHAPFITFKQRFNRFNGYFEMRFVTQLRRTTCFPNDFSGMIAQSLGYLGGAAGSLPNAIGGGTAMYTALEAASEAVGQYTWGFKITSNPFKVTPINPRWQRFK